MFLYMGRFGLVEISMGFSFVSVWLAVGNGVCILLILGLEIPL